ncbi:MAG: hypothetical protein AMXMBFR82_26560 [Candidatus Hydrogenedentota bacterium]
MPDFARTIRLNHDPGWAVRSHGWPTLAPCSLDANTLQWIATLPSGAAQTVTIRWRKGSRTLRIAADASLNRRHGDAVDAAVRRMFFAAEKFDAFWQHCASHPVLKRCALERAGAMFRSATLYEDLVKTICTTNCTWGNTKRMVHELCRLLGEAENGPIRPIGPIRQISRGGPIENGQPRHAFPTIEAVARARHTTLLKAGLGYRAPYIRDLSRAILDGALDLHAWETERDAAKLRHDLLAVKGIGPYAANHLLMLLGHYDFIPCDSVAREFLGLPTGATAREVDKAMHTRYEPWGKYAALAYMLERVIVDSMDN